MNENQRKWLLELQSKGVVFQVYVLDTWVSDNKCDFSYNITMYRIRAQPVPDTPDWREVCWDMQSKGVGFKFLWESMWENPGADLNFTKERDRYQIPAQPLPEWREEMTEPTETKPEVPHRDLQIQWHEDCVHSLKTGEPMREWEVKDYAGDWQTITDFSVHPSFGRGEYRRKPRMKKVAYWHCVVEYTDAEGKSGKDIITSFDGEDEVKAEIERHVERCGYGNFSPITKTTVEIPDQD